MSEKVDVSGTIKVEDNASPTIRRIQQSIGRISESARRVGTSFQRVSNMGMLGGVAANAQRASGAMRGLVASIGRTGAAVAAVAGVAGIGGLAATMQNYVNTTDQLAKSAQRIGITAEQLQQLRHAADLSGVSVETLDSSMMQLTRRMGEAAAGRNQELAGLMRRLGISLRDASGQVRNAAEVLPQLAQGFNRNTNAATRARMANTLFGRAGQDMINMLAAGGPELRSMMAELVRLGMITNEQAANAEALNDAQGRMNTSIRGVSNAIMGTLVPAMTPLVDQFTEWVVINREWIATGVSDFMKDFGRMLAEIPWAEVGQTARDFGNSMAWVTEQVGGFKNVIMGFAGIMGAMFLAPFVKVIATVGSLALSLTSVLVPALTAVLGVFRSMAMALTANPIGIAVVAIAAAAYMIWKYWEPISAFFIALWDDVKVAFDAAVAWLRPFLDTFTASPILAVWQGLSAAFLAIWQAVSDVFTGALGALGAILLEFVPEPLIAAWGRLQTFFTRLWASIVRVFESAWETIKPIIDLLMAAIGPLIGAVQRVGGAVATVQGAAAGAISGAAGAAGGALSWARERLFGPSNPVAPAVSPLAPATSPVQSAQQAAPPVARVDGEVETRIRVDLGPGLVPGTATTQDRGRVHSTVDVGQTMVPQ